MQHPSVFLLCTSSVLIIPAVTRDANFAMDSTWLTVGGFSQPPLAHGLLEQSGSTKIRLSQRFLWMFPWSRFNTLEGVDKHFTDGLSKETQLHIHMHYT